MEHVVRPVWIALKGTTVPADIKERCRRSFEHTRQYFLKEIGKTFQVAELQIIRTHFTAEHFQEYRSEYVPFLSNSNHWGCRKYSPETPNLEIFCFNLIAFLKQTLDADNTQAWVIFIPASEKGRCDTAAAVPIHPGGYAVISANLLLKEFARGDLSDSHYIRGQYALGSGREPEALIAHELCHIFGLYKDLKETRWLMGYRDNELRNCLLRREERWILSRSPFLVCEK